MKAYLFGEVKTVKDTSNPNGEFEVILSAPTLDRDGEVVAAAAFEPLPESVPFHAFHNFSDPIGRATPYYEGDILKARGTYASTPRAQEIRMLVADGVIGHTSVGLMNITREDRDGVPHITKAELLEGSFVSVPANRQAAVLLAKSADKAALVDPQAIHDLSVAGGAQCKHQDPVGPDPETAAAPAAATPVIEPPARPLMIDALIAEAETLLLD